MTAGGRVHVVPDAAVWLHEMHRLARELVPVAAAAGGCVEHKGATLSVHYREAPDPDGARRRCERDAIPVAHDTGWSRGSARMTIELLPPLPFDKGAPCARCCAPAHRARACTPATTTDIDAFRVVDVAVAVRLARDAARPRRGGDVRRRRHRRRHRLSPRRLRARAQRSPRCCLSARVWRRATSSTVPSSPAARPSGPARRARAHDHASQVDEVRAVDAEEHAAGRTSSSSRIDCSRLQPLVVGRDPAVVAVGLA